MEESDPRGMVFGKEQLMPLARPENNSKCNRQVVERTLNDLWVQILTMPIIHKDLWEFYLSGHEWLVCQWRTGHMTAKLSLAFIFCAPFPCLGIFLGCTLWWGSCVFTKHTTGSLFLLSTQQQPYSFLNKPLPSTPASPPWSHDSDSLALHFPGSVLDLANERCFYKIWKPKGKKSHELLRQLWAMLVVLWSSPENHFLWCCRQLRSLAVTSLCFLHF